ncbi:MAG: hypothetical protein ACXVA9_14335 [Bdellovibrionales bacterium]
MKIREVPQDQDPSFAGGKKICYAVDSDGKFVQVKTSGWDVEAEAKDLAWKSIDTDVARCGERVRSGQASPLEYFMKFRQMDAKLLADNMGMFAWRVKWHLRPARFRKLSERWLARYAECLDIPAATLRDFSGV